MKIPWKLKSTIFLLIDIFNVPKLLYFLQKYLTRRSRVGLLPISEIWHSHVDAISQCDNAETLFEFGAGKNLAQNFYLSAFVKNQIVVDLHEMLDFDLVEMSRSILSQEINLRAEGAIKHKSDLLKYGIDYRAPYDAAKTGFSNCSIDVCVSTATLEHIPKENIKAIFLELSRILKDNGVVSTRIDYSDHYAHTDSSISLLNYLNYSLHDWKKYNHSCHYQNRLRHYEYIEIFENCGFKVLSEQLHYDEIVIDEKIRQKFKGFPESWAATSGHVVLKKKSATNETFEID